MLVGPNVTASGRRAEDTKGMTGRKREARHETKSWDAFILAYQDAGLPNFRVAIGEVVYDTTEDNLFESFLGYRIGAQEESRSWRRPASSI